MVSLGHIAQTQLVTVEPLYCRHPRDAQSVLLISEVSSVQG